MTDPDGNNSTETLVAVSHDMSEGDPTTAASTTGLVSFRKPDGLILSTGNLYFTSHDANFGTVWRMGQNALPGQEVLLYAELGARFGDIVFAQVGGAFFAYFFATEGLGSTVTIKRIPLTGGPAEVLASMTDIDVFNNRRNLVTDGFNLYWQDVSSVRKMPLGGGAVTQLDPSHPNTPTAGVALQGKNLIYASFQDIRFVATDGSSVISPQFRTIVTAASRVTALHTVSNGVYWGEQSGAVKVKVGSTITTLPSTAGLVPTSISSNGFTAGAAQAWSECGSSSCMLQFAFPIGNFSNAIGPDALGVSVTSTGTVFWGDAAGVHRQTF
jgi:hypothetical protein